MLGPVWRARATQAFGREPEGARGRTPRVDRQDRDVLSGHLRDKGAYARDRSRHPGQGAFGDFWQDKSHLPWVSHPQVAVKRCRKLQQIYFHGTSGNRTKRVPEKRSCQASFSRSTSTHKKPRPKHNQETDASAKRRAACGQVTELPSCATSRSFQVRSPSVWPPWTQNPVK